MIGWFSVNICKEKYGGNLIGWFSVNNCKEKYG